MEFLFNEFKSALLSGTLSASLLALVLAYLGGILSSFTPCIYPMIPITVAFVGGTAERSVKTGWVLSSFYVLGMALVYAVLGVVASLSGKIFGTLTNTPSWYLFIGVVLILSSLWMLDVIHFDPNVWITKWTAKKLKNNEAPTPTILGALFLGGSSGFIAAPCTTPVLTSILALIAHEKSVIFGALLMFVFALGLGTILVVIGTFTGAVKLLPKSGQWLNRVKIFSGLLILLLAEYFIFKAGTLK